MIALSSTGMLREVAVLLANEAPRLWTQTDPGWSREEHDFHADTCFEQAGFVLRACPWGAKYDPENLMLRWHPVIRTPDSFQQLIVEYVDNGPQIAQLTLSSYDPERLRVWDMVFTLSDGSVSYFMHDECYGIQQRSDHKFDLYEARDYIENLAAAMLPDFLATEAFNRLRPPFITPPTP